MLCSWREHSVVVSDELDVLGVPDVAQLRDRSRVLGFGLDVRLRLRGIAALRGHLERCELRRERALDRFERG